MKTFNKKTEQPKTGNSSPSFPFDKKEMRKKFIEVIEIGDLKKVREILNWFIFDSHMHGWDQDDTKMFGKALDIATVDNNDEKILQALLTIPGMQWTKEIVSRAVRGGAVKGNTQTLNMLLTSTSKIIEWNKDDYFEWLHFAIEESHVETTKMLLTISEIQWNEDDYIRLLHFAIGTGNIKTAEILLEISGIHWNEKNIRNALSIAGYHVQVVEWILATPDIEWSEEILKLARGRAVIYGYKKARDEEEKKVLEAYKEVERKLSAVPGVEWNQEIVKLIDQIKAGDRKPSTIQKLSALIYN